MTRDGGRGAARASAAGGAPGAFPERGHDHEACVEQALAEAAGRCARRGARLTVLRSRVLEILWESHRPLGAYAILEALARQGHSPAPPTVYRALDFLQEHGLAHRLASLNAFVGCSRPGHAGSGQFLICTRCGAAAELDDPRVEGQIRRSARSHGFEPAAHTLEVAGLCPHCR